MKLQQMLTHVGPTKAPETANRHWPFLVTPLLLLLQFPSPTSPILFLVPPLVYLALLWCNFGASCLLRDVILPLPLYLLFLFFVHNFFLFFLFFFGRIFVFCFHLSIIFFLFFIIFICFFFLSFIYLFYLLFCGFSSFFSQFLGLFVPPSCIALPPALSSTPVSPGRISAGPFSVLASPDKDILASLR